MFCCCKGGGKNKGGGRDGPGPIVAFFGSSGHVGKSVIGPFVEALMDGRIPELRIPCRDPSKDEIQGFVAKGAKSFQVDFTDRESLVEALSGTHTVVSCLGTGEGSVEMNQALVEAMFMAGVKSFFPSEFGANHYKVKPEYNHPVFDAKKAVFNNAKAKGLRPIRILCSDLLEMNFGPWLGFDSNSEVWTVLGSPNVPVALTSEKDVGRFTLEAVLMAYSQPNKIGDLIQVCSFQKTLAEYAAAFDKVAGSPLKLEIIPLAQAKEEYKNSKDLLYLLRVLMCEGIMDYTNATANELLNPGGQRWTLQKFEDYAQQTGGRPFKN